MRIITTCYHALLLFIGLIGLGLLAAPVAMAHCDTMDGPVVSTAKQALEKGDVTPVLKWVKKDDEGEIREAFARTIAVRGKGPEAKELADRYFFETLVRVHRAGEGAPYTGLMPVGADPGPAVRASDKALDAGKAEEVVKLVSEKVAEGIRKRFQKALEAKKQTDSSVEAGREFVEAYVTFVHYVERLYQDAAGHAAEHGEAEEHAVHGEQHHE